MKKEVLFLSVMTVLGIAINSCISEIVPEPVVPPVVPPEPPTEPVKKDFRLRFSTVQMNMAANTYASPELSSDGTKVEIGWGKLERAGVFMIGDNNTSLYANREYVLMPFYESERSLLLLDTVTTAAENAYCYGYSPYQSPISGTTVSYRLNSEQNQLANNTTSRNLMDTVISPNLFLLSPPTATFPIREDGTGILNFQTVFSVLRLQVTKSSAFQTFNAQRIKSVQLYIADKNNKEVPLNYNLAGNYSIDVSKPVGTSGYQGPVFASGAGNNKITATVTTNNYIDNINNSPYVWFIVNPIQIQSNECLVSIVETDGWRIISTHDITELKTNTFYRMSVVAEESNSMSDIYTVGDYFETSNCYVMSRPGVWHIPVNTTLQGDTVVWLWASKEKGGKNFAIEELINPATIVYNRTGNYIRFRVGTSFGQYTRGNVILALKNKATGEIVWTWHIWITDDLKDVSYVPYAGGGDIRFLDRNIGALSADTVSQVDNFGFVYQWGRKDPFFGYDGISNETTPFTIANNHTILNGVTWERIQTTQLADSAKKHPMRFICNPASSAVITADWQRSSSNPSLWSDSEKTNYDPCPQVYDFDTKEYRKYKVPSKMDLSVLHDAWDNYVDDANEPNWTFQPTGGYWYWKYECIYPRAFTTVWPAAGMRQGRWPSGRDTGAQLTGSGQCIYWTSTPVNITGIPAGGSYRIYTTPSAGLFSRDEFGDNADAYPVRCVKINPLLGTP